MGLCFSFDDSVHSGTKTSTKVSSRDSLASSRHEEGEILQSPNLKSFSFDELRTATGNFAYDGVLGAGGFGSVFKGSIHDNISSSSKTGIRVAVKMLQQHGSQGQQEWLAEIKYLGQLCHPNLVKLIGYSMDQHRRLLVYEFMPNGSLDRHLNAWNSRKRPLSWNLRMKVALGAAQGLTFLHNVAKVIHRDLKSSDILLDYNFNPKISDFGLAKDRPEDRTHVSSRSGIGSCAAPEYVATGRVSTKSDVYSFGVILLQLISGKPFSPQHKSGLAADNNYRPDVEQNLVEWAMPLLGNKRTLFRVIDSYLEGEIALRGAKKLVNLAVHCLSLRPAERPDMEQVVKALEQIAKAPPLK